MSEGDTPGEGHDFSAGFRCARCGCGRNSISALAACPVAPPLYRRPRSPKSLARRRVLAALSPEARDAARERLRQAALGRDAWLQDLTEPQRALYRVARRKSYTRDEALAFARGAS